MRIHTPTPSVQCWIFSSNYPNWTTGALLVKSILKTPGRFTLDSTTISDLMKKQHTWTPSIVNTDEQKVRQSQGWMAVTCWHLRDDTMSVALFTDPQWSDWTDTMSQPLECVTVVWCIENANKMLPSLICIKTPLCWSWSILKHAVLLCTFNEKIV